MTSKKKIDKILQFRNFPIALWVIGFATIVFSSYLVYNLTGGLEYGGTLIPIKEGMVQWWHILIVVFIFLIGVIFIWAGKIETLTFNK